LPALATVSVKFRLEWARKHAPTPCDQESMAFEY
jgi:hypothetical protein